MKRIGIDPEIERQLRNAKYGVFGHSAVQICAWTKKSLHDQGFCYKQKFYGIDTHRCMEFSPSAVVCQNNCVFCWRPMEFMRFTSMDANETYGPEEIYENLIEARRKLLSGFPGDGITNMDKHKESLVPNHYAISLSGEPTIYPKLPELINFLKSKPETKSVFVVTNGEEPNMLGRMKKEGLPTQLYISVNAPNKELFREINRPAYRDGWERFLLSLDVFKNLKTRRVLRLTMIKGMNMDISLVNEYADLVMRANPHFIEVKAYMWIGFSRNRLKEENMPLHSEVRKFAEKLAKQIDFELVDEKKDSRVVLLQNSKERIGRIIK